MMTKSINVADACIFPSVRIFRGTRGFSFTFFWRQLIVTFLISRTKKIGSRECGGVSGQARFIFRMFLHNDERLLKGRLRENTLPREHSLEINFFSLLTEDFRVTNLVLFFSSGSVAM